jgi:hypothetical protein
LPTSQPTFLTCASQLSTCFRPCSHSSIVLKRS